jgi:hypothetical protein
MLTNGPSIQPQQHEMQLKETHASGVEEWYCPQCGRRFLLSWPPTYEKVVLDVGDEYAVHSGGKGGLHMGIPQVSDSDEPILSDELRAALEEALADVDFDNL